MKTKVLIVDDHPLTRAGVRVILEDNNNIEITGEAKDGLEAINQVEENKPDIVVMDITMPQLSGIDATREILIKHPDVKVIALSIHSGERFVKEMLNAGAVGYLLKDETSEELLKAIEKVGKGDIYLSSAVTRAALRKEEEGQDLIAYNVLRTKLARPSVTGDVIMRHRITDALDKNVGKPFSLVSAGAGYGKSVAVSQWLEQTKNQHTWISLDEEHNNLRIFLAYLVEAVEKVMPGALLETGKAIGGTELPPFKDLLYILFNELCDIEDELILVLDDYHKIKVESIHKLLEEWLKFPPPKVHLCMITRVDPPIEKIDAMRTTGRMTEIRMDKLSFTKDETVQLIKQLVSIDLSDSAIHMLHDKTEGWIIVLRLVSLILKRGENLDQVLKAVEGGLSTISDFFVSEVLSKQPEHIKYQLLFSSILNRICPELLDEIWLKEEGRYSGDEFIRWLHNANMFVIDLDIEGKWYRYHHLFQNLLQAELNNTLTADQIGDIHNKASIWFEKNELIEEAIEHSIRAGDPDRAVRIISENWENIFEKDLWNPVERWLSFLPEEIIVKSANLLLARMWIAMRRHKVEIVPQIIQMIEQTGSELSDTETGYLEFAKLMISYMMGSGEEALEHANRAIELIPKERNLFRCDAYGWWSVAMQRTGQGDKAVEVANEALKSLDPNRNSILFSRRMIHPNFIFVTGANLPPLKERIEKFFNIPEISPYMLGFGWYFRAVCCWWGNNLNRCLQNFENSIKYRYNSVARQGIDCYICLALALQELNRPQDAIEVITQGSQFAKETNDPIILSLIASGQARLNLMQKNYDAAEEWLNSTQHTGLDPSMLWWVEVPAMTRCRVLIAKSSYESLHKAVELLKEYHEYSKSIYNKLRIIEIALLQTEAHYKLESESKALKSLKYAVDLACDGEWIRPFVETGEVIIDLLLQIKEKVKKREFIDKILDEINRNEQRTINIQVIEEKKDKREKLNLLTQKELEILKCIAQGLRNQEIADELYNSELTIKKHISNMLHKMQVRNRLSLVTKAKEIGII